MVLMAISYQTYKNAVKWTVICLWLPFLLWGTLQAQPHNEHTGSTPQTADPVLVKEYVLDGKGSLSVFTISGDIDVISAANSRKVRIELYADRGFSFWFSGNTLDNYRITTLKRGDEISTSVEPKGKHKSNFWSAHTAFSYKIVVPKAISMNLKTLNGSVKVQDVNGKHMIKSNAGDIDVADVSGVLKAYSTGGNISIKNSKGTIFARADGGNIKTNNIEGELRVKIHGGRITSSSTSGSMIAEVNAGDIDASFRRVGEGINLQTNAGDIHLEVPKQTGYGLYARGDHVEFKRTGVFKGTYSSNLAEGSINGGGTPVNLRANAGKVIIQLKK